MTSLQVIEIKKNGAIVVMHKNGDKKAFIPGWAHKVSKKPGTYLTTTLAVTLTMGDLIAFYIDPKQKAAPYYGVGCNVLVLKHANSGDAVINLHFLTTVGIRNLETIEIWCF